MQPSKQQVEPLYQVHVTCSNCTHEYKTSKVRTSFQKIVKTDTDFCVHYADVNPDFYTVRVCPLCGYAHTENFREFMKPQARERIYDKITKKWNHHDYGAERNLGQAITIYKLALLSAQLTEQSDAIVGGLCFKIGCFYRFSESSEQERRFMQFALESYINAFEHESKIDLNEAKMMYMIGELHRRLGNYEESIRWFSRLVTDKAINDIGMIRRAREQWQVAKTQLSEQKALAQKEQAESSNDQTTTEE